MSEVHSRKCSFEGCLRPQRGGPFCNAHRQQLRKGKGLVQVRAFGRTLADRLVLRTKKLANGCIVWTGPVNHKGYGSLPAASGKKSDLVHRVSFKLFVGQIPPGLWVLHDCPSGDNPACVNPLHLWLGDVKDNNADMKAKNRHQHGETNGHTPLRDDDVREIRKMCANGVSQGRVGKLFGVTQSSVSRIVSLDTWRHIT